MNCHAVRDQLSAYFDGELPSALADEIQLHVDQCDECAEELSAFRALQELATSRPELTASAPTWSAIVQRMEACDSAAALPSKSDRNPYGMYAVLLTLAASLMLFAFTRYFLKSPSFSSADLAQAKVGSIDLEEVVALYRQNSELALDRLSEQFAGEEVTMDQAETSLGHRSLVRTSMDNRLNSSPVQLVATRLLTFPLCECPVGDCNCGPNGCNCVACLCRRPDGSTYLVLEQCKSQGLDFGDLPVQLVMRGGQQLQQVMSQDFITISWVGNGGRMTAVGLQDEQEIDQLLASR